jgi:hypothetical protein
MPLQILGRLENPWPRKMGPESGSKPNKSEKTAHFDNQAAEFNDVA